jgi:hypothetical protein
MAAYPSPSRKPRSGAGTPMASPANRSNGPSTDEVVYVRNALTGTMVAQHHHHLAAGPAASPPKAAPFAPPWQANKHTAKTVRAFDLGRDGLKTCVFAVRNDGTVDPVPIPESVQLLGHAPGEVGGVAHRRTQTVAAWLQHHCPRIALELHSSKVDHGRMIMNDHE